MKTHAINARQAYLDRVEPHSITLLHSGQAPHKSLDQYFTFSVNRNFYYLTGIDAPNLILMLIKGEKDSQTYLFLEENTDFIIKWEGARITKDEAHEKSGIEVSSMRYLENFEATFNQMMNYARSPFGVVPQTLYLDLYHVKADQKPQALHTFGHLKENYPELKNKNLNEHLAYLRMFKSEEELTLLKDAIAMTNEGLTRVLSTLKTRDNEHQIEAEFNYAITLAGASGNAFDTIAASGANATVLHYHHNNQPLPKDGMLLLDLGALNKNYAADISRTYPISGVYSDRQKAIYEAVLDVNKRTVEMVKPGVTWSELNAFAKDALAKHAVALKLIEKEEDILHVYYHSIGHFLGLDVHDVGLYHQPLEAGMVITIEPGLYVSAEGIGVRIEDDILVTEDGYENLSKAIIKDVKDIEKAMR